MKKLLILIFFVANSMAAVAQDAAETKSFWSDPVNDPLAPLYALIGLIAIVIVLIGLVAASMISVLNTLSENVAKERAQKLGVAYKPKPSLWNRFVQSMNDAVPVEEEKSVELDHNYDGIRELDNHLPPWWKYLFYATIAWSLVYMVVYHLTDSLPLQEDEYRNEVASADELKKKFIASKPKADVDESTLTYTPDAAIIAKGKDLYSANCSACHKADGGGGIGPNLTDEYWLHGGGIKDIFAVVKNGVPEKGMVAWATVLSPEQLRDVSFFVMSLQGTNPPGAKAPQGNIYQNTGNEVKADSTASQAAL